MDIKEALLARKSIRAYRKDNVSRSVIEEILTFATRAPSSLNSQPWEFVVVSGKVLDDIRDRNEMMLLGGEPPRPDFPLKRLKGIYRERQVAVFTELCRLGGFDSNDKQTIAYLRRRSYRFFEAPVAIIICADASLGSVRSNFDLGLVSQDICLAALEYGLGTCLCLEAVSYPQTISEIAAVPPSKKICVAIALGYPETEHPANLLRSQREPLENITRWCGFEGEV